MSSSNDDGPLAPAAGGNDTEDFKALSGARLWLGYWLDNGHHVAVEAGGFGLQQASSGYYIQSESVHLTEITDLATTLAISNCEGVARLGNINPSEKLCRMIRGSSSCDEDRLGVPEQPSDVQCTSRQRRTYGLTI